MMSIEATEREIEEVKTWLKDQIEKMLGFSDEDAILQTLVVDQLSKAKPKDAIKESLAFMINKNDANKLIDDLESKIKRNRQKRKDEREKRKREDGPEFHPVIKKPKIEPPSQNQNMMMKEIAKISELKKEEKDSTREKALVASQQINSRILAKNEASASPSLSSAPTLSSTSSTVKNLPTTSKVKLPEPQDLKAKIDSLLSSIAASKANLEKKQTETQVTKDSKPEDSKKKVIDAAEKIQQRLQGANAKAANLLKRDDSRFVPRPMRVDSSGKEIDEHGNVLSILKNLPTSLINKRLRIENEKLLFTSAPPPIETDPTKNPFYDPRVNLPKADRQKRSFQFVEPGTYIKKAQHMRKRAQLAAFAKTVPSLETKDDASNPLPTEGDANPNLIALGVKEEPVKPRDPIPDVEWWDSLLLVEKDDYTSKLIEEKITHYVEHPVLTKPPAEAPPPPPQPLKMTKQEMKKMKRLKRMELQREKQERILLGLDKPPEPKVKISNLMRVLGQEAVQDPTQIEKEVRRQMAQRLKNHQQRNEARKLTPEERKEKKKRKLLDDTSLETNVAIYRVDNLSDQKYQYKIDINSFQNQLSGCMILCPVMNLVIIEGGPKSLRRFKKLMLRRIDWTIFHPSKKQKDSVDGEEPMEVEKPEELELKNNKCLVVWEGTVLKPNFKNFKIEKCLTESDARNYLRKHALEHYWELSKQFQQEVLLPAQKLD